MIDRLSEQGIDRLASRLSKLGYGDCSTRHWILGVASGYSDCCIEFFIGDWSEMTLDGFNFDYVEDLPRNAGYIPCPKCKEKMLRERSAA